MSNNPPINNPLNSAFSKHLQNRHEHICLAGAIFKGLVRFWGFELRLIVALILVLLSVQAQSAVPLYGEARLGAGGVRHSDLDFYPGFGSFSAGLFVFDNIGIEAFVDTQLSTGENGVFELGITRAAGAAVRLQSPPQRGLQAYVLLGYVDFTLEQEGKAAFGSRTVRQSFDGIRLSVGVQQQLKIIDGLIFGVEYRNYYADSGITVDGVSVGLRYELK